MKSLVFLLKISLFKRQVVDSRFPNSKEIVSPVIGYQSFRTTEAQREWIVLFCFIRMESARKLSRLMKYSRSVDEILRIDDALPVQIINIYRANRQLFLRLIMRPRFITAIYYMVFNWSRTVLLSLIKFIRHWGQFRRNPSWRNWKLERSSITLSTNFVLNSGSSPRLSVVSRSNFS